MPSINRFPPYVIAAAVLFMIAFYYVFNVRQKNAGLERSVKVYREAMIVSKEKNKVLVKDALEKIDKKDARIQELEKENLSLHTSLGRASAKRADIEKKLKMKNDEIKKLHQLAADHKREITTLSKSVSKSKQVLSKLSEKAGHLMTDHEKLKKENSQLWQQNEKLQKEIEQQTSAKKTLDNQLNVLTREKRNLGAQVEDLTKKNQVIQESIKQKIKESYAVHRMMTPQAKPSFARETKKLESKLKTSQDLTQKVAIDGHKDSDDQVPRIMVNNSEITQKQVSKVMVNNSVTIPQKNVSKVMMNNIQNRGFKSDTIADAFVGKNTSAKSNFLGDEKATNAGTTHKVLTEHTNNEVNKRPLHSLKANKPQGNARESVSNETLTDVQSQISTAAGDNESLNQDKTEENIESRTEFGMINKLSPSKERGEEKVGEIPRQKHALPVFPRIEDEIIDRQSIQSPKEYGDPLQDIN